MESMEQTLHKGWTNQEEVLAKRTKELECMVDAYSQEIQIMEKQNQQAKWWTKIVTVMLYTVILLSFVVNLCLLVGFQNTIHLQLEGLRQDIRHMNDMGNTTKELQNKTQKEEKHEEITNNPLAPSNP